jgi:hypothetical protein
MTKCKAIKANFTPCTSLLAPATPLGVLSKQLCGSHSQSIAKEAAKESARNADNTSALMKAADRTSKAFAEMTISHTPGTEREYAQAKADETALKLRVKTDNDKHEKDVMTHKCKEAIAIKLYEGLNLETDTAQTCYAIPSSQNIQCAAIGSPHDHLCDTHRATLVNHASVLSTYTNSPVTPNTLPFRFATDLNNHLLYEAFREGVRAARFARFGVTLAPAPVAALPNVPPPRRIAAEPVLTAPVDVASHVARQHLEMSLALEKPITCPICYDAVTAENIVMTHCGHVYCGPCLTASRQRERKCPQCRVTI